MKSLNACQNCGSIWAPGSEEWDWQQCDACGWSPWGPIDEDDDFDDCEFEDYDRYDQREDSRNV